MHPQFLLGLELEARVHSKPEVDVVQSRGGGQGCGNSGLG